MNQAVYQQSPANSQASLDASIHLANCDSSSSWPSGMIAGGLKATHLATPTTDGMSVDTVSETSAGEAPSHDQPTKMAPQAALHKPNASLGQEVHSTALPGDACASLVPAAAEAAAAGDAATCPAAANQPTAANQAAAEAPGDQPAAAEGEAAATAAAADGAPADPQHGPTPGSLDAGSRQGSTNAAAAAAAAAAATEPTDGTGAQAEAAPEQQEGAGDTLVAAAAAAAAAAAVAAAGGAEATDGDESSAAAAAAAAALAVSAATLKGHGSHICLVDGCEEDLSDMKPYFRRSKICPAHQGAPTVLLGGVVCRFCQQCTRCHPLDEFDGTKRSCRSQLAHHNKSRKHRRRCTPGSFYSTKRSKPHAAQAARAKARLLAAQQAAAAAAAAGGDVAAQQAAAAAAIAAAAAAAMAEAQQKKAAAKAAGTRRSPSAVTAAAAAAKRAVKTEPPSSSNGTGSGPSSSHQTRRVAAAAAAAAAMDSEAAAHHQAAAAAAMGLHAGYVPMGLLGDVWGRMDYGEVASGPNSSYNRYTAALMASGQALGLDPTSSGGYSLSQLQAMQQHQAQQTSAGYGGHMGGAASMAAGSQHPTMSGGRTNSMGMGVGPLVTTAGSGGSVGAVLCGSGGLLQRRATGSGGGSGARTTPQSGEDDAGSSSCCSSRGSPMLNSSRRQHQGLLMGSASAPSGSLAQFFSHGGMGTASMGTASPLAGMASMPALLPQTYGLSPQQQQQLLAANAAAAGAGGMQGGIARGSSPVSAYAAARAAAVAAATAAQNGRQNGMSFLSSEQAHAIIKAGGSSLDSCADIWAGQPGSGLENGLAGVGANGVTAGAAQDAAAYGSLGLMHNKVGRNRLEQSPGASARQAAAMADYAALQQQQQQLWSRLQNAQQAEAALASRGGSGHLMTPAEVAAAVSLQAGTAGVQGLLQACGSNAASAIAGGAAHDSNAAAAAAVAAAGHMLTVPMVNALRLPADFETAHAAGTAQGGVSLQRGVAEGVEPGAKAARDAAVASELMAMAMMNPTEFLGESRSHFDPAWQRHSSSMAGQGAPAQGTAAGAAGGPAHTAAAGNAAAGASGAAAHDGFAQGHAASTHVDSGAAGAAVGAAGPRAAAAAGSGEAAAGLDAHDIADLWDVLEDYEGGDKESCDALFEHLIDLC